MNLGCTLSLLLLTVPIFGQLTMLRVAAETRLTTKTGSAYVSSGFF
jgi:hypothetical protein